MANFQEALPGAGASPIQLRPPDAQQRPAGPEGPEAPDDESSRSHRQLIGSVGLALPILLWLIAGLRPNDPAHPWKPQDSISAYYYTGAVAAFVGLLVALALYLFAYRGFRNKWQKWDLTAARIAGVAALGVAFFPTSAPKGLTEPAWWTPAIRDVHYVSAALLFLMFAVFSLLLFTRTDPTRQRPADKQWRNTVYYVCGLFILAGILWTAWRGYNKQPIFAPESLALGAFAVSWLVKGSVHKSIRELMSR